jgi:hypothetical protein
MECKSINTDGIFVCNTPLTGTYVGLTRTEMRQSDFNLFNFAEIRAFTWVPFDEFTSTLSSDVMTNASLINSVHFNEPLPTGSNPLTNVGGIGTDDLF